MRRAEKRTFIALPVRAFGIDAEGRSFRHLACTLDVSAHGARIMGLHSVQVGQEVTLEYKGNKVRFAAVWVGDPETPRQGQVGLRLIDSDKQLANFEEFLAGAYVDNWRPGQAPSRA